MGNIRPSLRGIRKTIDRFERYVFRAFRFYYPNGKRGPSPNVETGTNKMAVRTRRNGRTKYARVDPNVYGLVESIRLTVAVLVVVNKYIIHIRNFGRPDFTASAKRVPKKRSRKIVPNNVVGKTGRR